MVMQFVVALLTSQVGPVKVVATDFTLVGLEPALGTVYQDRFIGGLGSDELLVTTSRDVQQLLGLERQRALLGCDTLGSTCLAELAGALGVEVVLTGSVARSDSGFIVSLRALRASDGRALTAPNARVGSEAALLDWLDAQAGSLRAQLLRSLRVTAAAPAPTMTRWVPAMVGGALVVAGGVCLGISTGNYFSLRSENPPPLADINATRVTGERLLPTGVVLAAVGVAGIAWSLVWNATAPRPVQASLSPLPDGAVMSLSGRFP